MYHLTFGIRRRQEDVAMRGIALLLLATAFTHGFGQVEFATEKTSTYQEPEETTLYTRYDNDKTEIPDGEFVSNVKTNGISDKTDAISEAGEELRSLTTLIKQITSPANHVTENLTPDKDRRTNQTFTISSTETRANNFVVPTSNPEKNELESIEGPLESDQTTEEKSFNNFGQTTPSGEFVTLKKVESSEQTNETDFEEPKQEIYDASSAFVAIDNFTSSSSEETERTEDFVEKQIKEAINSMPKLPELILSDNKTHFKFHKDSEEMFIDEKITEIAKELAEKSLRKRYEEQKLSHLTAKTSKITKQSPKTEEKPIKLKKIKLPALKPKSVSERNFEFSKTSDQARTHKPEGNTKLPWPLSGGTNSPTSIETPQIRDRDFFEKVTNLPQILKINKTENQIKEMYGMLKMKLEPSPTGTNKPITPIPITLYGRQNKPETEKSSLMISLLDKGKPEASDGNNNNTFYSHLSHIKTISP